MPKVNRTYKRITDVSDRHLRRLVAKEISEQQSMVSPNSSSCRDKDSEVTDYDGSSEETLDCNNACEIQNIFNRSEDLDPRCSSSIQSDTSNDDPENTCENALQQQISDDENVEHINFETSLSRWAITENISHSALSGLLEILKTHNCHSTLPKDPRTLLNTPRNTTIRSVPPGSYWHLGLRTALNQFIEECGTNLSSAVDTFNVAISTDGLPLSRSSSSALWPILCSINSSNLVYLIGAYWGYEKPNDASLFLADFINEAIELSENGLSYRGKLFKVCIDKLICDAPAKSLVLNIKGHSGYSSCTKCVVEGEYRRNRVCFADIGAAKRTDAGFRNYTDENYHLGNCPFVAIPNFGPVSNVPLDYLHLGCYGAMRKMGYSWVSGDLSVRLPHRKCQLVSDYLEDRIKPVVPIEFVRKPRSLQYIKQWKATEFRQLLLYTGPVVFKDVLSRKIYNHFITLHVAFRILCCESLSKQYLNYAQQLLEHFVSTYAILYGEYQVSYNIHGLIHLPDDVAKFGPLDTFSAFKYENFLQTLKKLIRKSDKPLQQLSRRYSEMKRNFKVTNMNIVQNVLKPQVCLPHSYRSPLLPTGNNPQYKRLRYNGYTFKIDDSGNDCCQLIDGNIIKIENIVHSSADNCLMIIGKEYLQKRDFFTEPCASSLINIFVVSNLSASQSWPALKINRKIFMIPHSAHQFVAMPLLHIESQ